MQISKRTITVFGVLAGSFLAAVEATIVSTAMPTVVAQLGGLAHYSWVFSGYILTSTVTMPLWGKLSDLFGRKPFYLASIGLFLTGSALSGASQSMSELVVFRAIQGLGAGGLLPLGMTIIGDLYTLEERARMQGLFGVVWGIASIVGPLVGGLITQAFSWRWVFYLNLPLGTAAAILVAIGLGASARPSRRPVDYPGALAMIGALTVLMLALSQTGQRDGVLGARTLGLLYVVACVLGALFVWIERRASEPILPLAMLRGRFLSAVTACGFLLGVAIFGSLSFVPLFIQSAMGGSATQAGSALTPLLLGWVGMSFVTGRVLPRVGYRPLIVGGLFLVTVGFMGLLQVSRHSTLAMIYVALGLLGVGMGMTTLSLMLALQNAVPRSHLGVATSVGAFTRSIGGAIGVALLGTVVTASLPAAGHVQPADMEHALHRAFLLAAASSVLAFMISLRVPPGLPSRPGQTLGEAQPTPSP